MRSGSSSSPIAQQKFDQGLALYNQKKFAEAIPLFERVLPHQSELRRAAQYLKLAQQEDERVKAERAAARAARTSTPAADADGRDRSLRRRRIRRRRTASRPAGDHRRRAVPRRSRPSSTAPSSDGYIIVRAGADEVARENLWAERRFIHTHVPRQVNVTKEFPAKNADLDFWVVVPSLGVNEHHTLRAQNFEPGVNRKLIVTIDPKSKRVDYQFN